MCTCATLSWAFTFLQLLSSFTSTRSEIVVNTVESTSAAPLVLQDINLIVVTDVHSWVAGHKHNNTLDANYGDVVSFYERLRDRSVVEKKDLFFVMNGDFIDGTGFSTYPPEHLTPILQKMPWDVLNIGNHELYRNSTIEYITQPDGFVDFWKGKYLTSNVLLVETGEPIGNRYTFLQGDFSEKTILVFGFLYDFQNHCPITEVEYVETVVNATWFQDVLKRTEKNFDAIVVLAHMDAFDPLVDVLLAKIRSICGDEMPVQFITGHSHQRKFKKLDNFSTTFEAGRFLDTIGFASLSFKDDNVLFEHEFIDGNVDAMKVSLGTASESFETEKGRELKTLIQTTETRLGLNKEVGCSPITYYLQNGLDKDNSLWRLFSKTIIPNQLFKGSDSMLFVQNPGALRYNLFQGIITRNDLIAVSPYNDTLFKVGSAINGTDFIQAFGEPNQVDGTAHFSELPQLIVSGNVIPDKEYEVFTVDFDLAYVTEKLGNITGNVLEPTQIEQTTGTIFEKYIQDEWPCPEPEEEKEQTWQQKFKDFF